MRSALDGTRLQPEADYGVEIGDLRACSLGVKIKENENETIFLFLILQVEEFGYEIRNLILKDS